MKIVLLAGIEAEESLPRRHPTGDSRAQVNAEQVTVSQAESGCQVSRFNEDWQSVGGGQQESAPASPDRSLDVDDSAEAADNDQEVGWRRTQGATPAAEGSRIGVLGLGTR